jgi:dihydrofolate synthase/folylpolyglutamate synthase
MKFGLRNTRTVLKFAGNPERSFRSIHIAGTNGKGSTASFIASIMMESGYRTGLYTSPHLVQFGERIRVNGRMIPERRLVEYVRELRPVIEEVRATFFEATTCIAFRYFADEGVDIAIIETGLGGRLDATNVVLPEISVITSIGLDHTEYLGTTLSSIAREKGGIIKSGVPVVTSSDDRVVLRVLGGIALRRNSRLHRSFQAVALSVQRGSRGAEAVRFRSRLFDVENVTLGLPGPHQHLNARLAVAALDIMLRRAAVRARFRRVTASSIRRGLRRTQEDFALNGRLQYLGRRKEFLLDVAHNPDGIRTLAFAVGQLARRMRIAVFGAMKDKDWKGMVRALRPVVDTIVCVAAGTPRALKSGILQRYAARAGMQAVNGKDVGNGIALAQRLAGASGQILVTGSHYVVGEALRILREKNP